MPNLISFNLMSQCLHSIPKPDLDGARVIMKKLVYGSSKTYHLPDHIANNNRLPISHFSPTI